MSPIVLTDFVKSVPQPVTAVLVQIAPFFRVVRYSLEIVSWRQTWYESWLGVGLWWIICLFCEATLRYLLPPVALIVVVVSRQSSTRIAPPLTTEQSLRATVTDLNTIHSLLPSLFELPASKATLLRIFALTYPLYLLLTHLVPLNILFGLAGTLILIARAPFTQLLIVILLRSAWVRWSLHYLASLISGHPLPPIIYSQQPTTTSPAPVPELRFLFTIYENQRWWVGLDWTAALLPAERPSWCSSPPAQCPVSPPSAFMLPPPTTVSFSDAKGRCIKRTATWRWEEPEWKVFVRNDSGSLSRVDKPIPDDTSAASGGSGSRLLKAAGMVRESGAINGGRGNTGNGNAEDENGFDRGHEDNEEDHVPTDPDGWIYGDNKWEGLSGKGGMGKYTRQRRWTRIAVVSETAQFLEDESTNVEHIDSSVLLPSAVTTTTDPVGNHNTQPLFPDQEVTVTGTIVKSNERESPLRQRLRRALSKSSNG